jgi:hypothetical protein
VEHLMVGYMLEDQKLFDESRISSFTSKYRLQFSQMIESMIDDGEKDLPWLDSSFLLLELAPLVKPKTFQGLKNKMSSILKKSTSYRFQAMSSLAAFIGAFMVEDDLHKMYLTIPENNVKARLGFLCGLLRTSKSAVMVSLVKEALLNRLVRDDQNDNIFFINEAVKFAGSHANELTTLLVEYIDFIFEKSQVSHIVMVHALLLKKDFKKAVIYELLRKGHESYGWESVLMHIAQCWDFLATRTKKEAVKFAASKGIEHAQQISCIMAKNPKAPLFMEIAEKLLTKKDCFYIYQAFRESMPVLNVVKIRLASHWFFADGFEREAMIDGAFVLIQLLR